MRITATGVEYRCRIHCPRYRIVTEKKQQQQQMELYNNAMRKPLHTFVVIRSRVKLEF